MIRRPRVWVVVVVAVLVVSAVPVAVLGASTAPAGETYVTNSGLGVTVNETHTIAADPYVDDETVNVSNVTFRGPNGGNVTVENFSGSHLNLSTLKVENKPITIDDPDKRKIKLANDIKEINYSTMALDGSKQFTVRVGADPNAAFGLGTGELTLYGLPPDRTVAAVNESGATVGGLVSRNQTTPAGTATLDLPNGTSENVRLLLARPPEIDRSQATPTGKNASDTVTLSVPVSDPDLGTGAGDQLTVRIYYQGSQVATKTITSNTTVSTTVSVTGGGTKEWSVEVDDGYDLETETQPIEFEHPANLTIRNETNPSQVIDGQPVDVRLIADDGAVTDLTTTNGTVPLDGLRLDQSYDAIVSTANYSERQTRIGSITQPADALLLPADETAVTSRFQLNDPTGTFGSSSTVSVEAPVNRSGNITYETIAADQVGVEGATFTLKKNTRYELKVSNGQTTAQLAQYRAEANETVVLEPSAPAVVAPNGSAVGYEVTYDADAQRINIEYIDPLGATDPLTVSVVGRDGTVLKQEQRYANTSALSLSVPTNGELNQTHYVIIEGERESGQAVSIREPVGPQQADITARLPDEVWIQVIGAAAILLVGGVFSQLNRGAGAVITSLFGGVLWFFGFMTGLASAGAIALAIGISTLNMFRLRAG